MFLSAYLWWSYFRYDNHMAPIRRKATVSIEIASSQRQKVIAKRDIKELVGVKWSIGVNSKFKSDVISKMSFIMKAHNESHNCYLTLTFVRLQNLPWYKTGLVSRQVLHLLSKLQNRIWPKTGQYKTCLVSNTKIEASIRATKPKPWQSHLTSETVEIFIQNEKAGLVPMQSRFWCGRLSVGTKPVLVQQV